MYHAQPVPRWAAPRLHEIVDVLAVGAGLDRPPAVFYIASPLANAFVIGRQDEAALAVTDGLLRVVNARELVGVLAHEVSHLRDGDTSIMSLSDLVARLAQWMGWVGLWSVLMTLPLALGQGTVMPLLLSLLLVVMPTVVTLLQLAVSRSREYDADLEAVAFTGDPEASPEHSSSWRTATGGSGSASWSVDPPDRTHSWSRPTRAPRSASVGCGSSRSGRGNPWTCSTDSRSTIPA
jgi:heat shock protein HtpX